MFKQLIIFCCLIFGVCLLVLYLFQRNLIYFPAKQKPNLQDYHARDMTSVSLHTQDKLVLTSWYKAAINNQPTVLYLHGNAGHIGGRIFMARLFMNAGFGVLLAEYRGYGGNSGVPTENGLYNDGRAALKFLQEKGVKPEQIVLYGESLGTGVATKLAAESSVCAVVLQSPFRSLVSLARYHYPWLILPPWDKFNSAERIGQIHAPVLVVHGKQDQIVPFTEGLTIFQQANEPKKMLQFEDKSHNDLWDAPGFSEAVIDFIKEHCLATKHKETR